MVELDFAFYSMSVKIVINFVEFSFPVFLAVNFSVICFLALEIEALIDATAYDWEFVDVLIVSLAVFNWV